MASARNVLGKLKSSDGRIRIKTLSGISAVVAAIALLVGVLPAMGYHVDNPQTVEIEGAQVGPSPVTYGGGSGACAFVDSAAKKELHINNPTPSTTPYTDDGIAIEVKVYDRPEGRVFDFEVLTEGIGVYDVVVNGGRQNNHYAYDGSTVGVVKGDKLLHAPRKNNSTTDVHNLSHVNICYDVQPRDFVCGEEIEAIRFGSGSFDGATATIFANSVVKSCTDKQGLFFIEDNEVTLDFGTGTGTVAGRADFTKTFDSPTDPTENFADLEYDPDGEGFVDVEWCNIRDAVVGDGEQFKDVLLGTELYPSLLNDDDTRLQDAAGDAIACKVAEIENAAGVQVTVVYFEFEDPQFR